MIRYWLLVLAIVGLFGAQWYLVTTEHAPAISLRHELDRDASDESTLPFALKEVVKAQESTTSRGPARGAHSASR